jgi:hypothetical protein
VSGGTLEFLRGLVVETRCGLEPRLAIVGHPEGPYQGMSPTRTWPSNNLLQG